MQYVASTMKIHNDPQRSEAWFSRRIGIPTASRFDRIITPQGKRSGQARKYMYELAYERISGKSAARDLSNVPHIAYGIANEARAVEAFEAHTGLATDPVGFITDDREAIGCSPDRVISNTRQALEIKCPTGPVMCGYLIDGVEESYRAQLQGQILIGGFDLVHFYAWSEELPPYYTKVVPDRSFIEALAQYLDEFNRELMLGVTHIRDLRGWPSNSVFPEDDPDLRGTAKTP